MMHARPIQAQADPIVYADQRKRKVFVLTADWSALTPPSSVRLEDQHGNVVLVPMDVQGDMTVLDVERLSAGGYLLKIAGFARKAIRVILC